MTWLGALARQFIHKRLARTTGTGTVQFLVSILVVALLSYVIFQFLYPYYAYQRVEGVMQDWVKVAVQKSDRDPREMIEKIRWLVDRYKIRLDPDDIQIEYDPETKVLAVYDDYDVYVELFGHENHYHFKPYAEAQGW